MLIITIKEQQKSKFDGHNGMNIQYASQMKIAISTSKMIIVPLGEKHAE